MVRHPRSRCCADGMLGDIQAKVGEIVARIPYTDLKSLLRNPEYIEQVEALLREDRVLRRPLFPDQRDWLETWVEDGDDDGWLWQRLVWSAEEAWNEEIYEATPDAMAYEEHED